MVKHSKIRLLSLLPTRLVFRLRTSMVRQVSKGDLDGFLDIMDLLCAGRENLIFRFPMRS